MKNCILPITPLPLPGPAGSAASLALADLSDVDTAGVSDEDVLQWDAGAGEWVPGEVTPGPLGDLSDVDTTGVSDEDVLQWDAGAGEWVPVAPAATGAIVLDDLTDVDVVTTTPALGHGLRFDGTEWVNSPIQSSDLPAISFGDLDDIDLSVLPHGTMPIYDSVSLTWKPGFPGLDDLDDVDTTGKNANDVIAWDGSGWVPVDLSGTYYTEAEIDALLADKSDTSHTHNLDDLGDVSAGAPTDGDSLVWNDSLSQWEPDAVSGGGGAITDLSDVDTTGAADGDLLTYVGGSAEWQAQAPSFGSAELGWKPVWYRRAVDPHDEFVVGTGYNDTINNERRRLFTGTTAGSAMLMTMDPLYAYLFNSAFRDIRGVFIAGLQVSTSNGEVVVGLSEDIEANFNDSPTDSFEGPAGTVRAVVRSQKVGGVITTYFESSDGTTLTTTTDSITAQMAYIEIKVIRDNINSLIAVRFYVNGVLYAEHTTGVPTVSGITFRPVVGVTNNAGTANTYQMYYNHTIEARK